MVGMDNLMTIGAFALETGLTVAALRHYDDVDVLKPAAVDPTTGYRRYRADQVRQAKLICALRAVDLPVDEIRDVLEADDDRFLHQALERHRRRLDDRAAAVARMTADLEEYLDKGLPMPALKGCRPVQVKLEAADPAFYEQAFGVKYDESISSFQFGTYGTEAFFLVTIGDQGSGYLVDDLEAVHRRAVEAGAREIDPPTRYPGMPRRSVVEDPSGNRVFLYQG